MDANDTHVDAVLGLAWNCAVRFVELFYVVIPSVAYGQGGVLEFSRDIPLVHAL